MLVTGANDPSRGLRKDLDALGDLGKALKEGKPDEHPKLVRVRDAILRTASAKVCSDLRFDGPELSRCWCCKAADAGSVQRDFSSSTSVSRVSEGRWDR